MNGQAVLDSQLNLYLPQIVVKSPDGDGYFQASLRYTQRNGKPGFSVTQLDNVFLG